MGCAYDQNYVRRQEGRQIWEKERNKKTGDGGKGRMDRERREEGHGQQPREEREKGSE